MTTRFAATLPDGSESFVGWAMWMLAGVWASRLLASGVILVEAGTRVLGVSAHGWVSAVTGVITAVLLAVVLAVVITFARHRLLMSEAVWLSLLAVPLYMWLLVARAALAGASLTIVGIAAPATAAVIGAWLLVRFWPGVGATGTTAGNASGASIRA